MSNVIAFPKMKKNHDENYEHLKGRLEYFKQMIERYEMENEKSTDSLFSGMSNAISFKHSKEIRDRFLSFYNAPSSKTWQEIRHYMIDANTTSWLLWINYDHMAPRSISCKKEDDMFPDPQLFVQYYLQHKEDRIKEYQRRMNEIEAELNDYKL